MWERQNSCRVHVGLLDIVPTVKLRCDCYVEEYDDVDLASCGDEYLPKNAQRPVLVGKGIDRPRHEFKMIWGIHECSYVFPEL